MNIDIVCFLMLQNVKNTGYLSLGNTALNPYDGFRWIRNVSSEKEAMSGELEILNIKYNYYVNIKWMLLR